MTTAYLHKSYKSARESRAGALQGVVSILRNHKSREDTISIIEEVKTYLATSADTVKVTESQIYSAKRDTINLRTPRPGDYLNPVSRTCRVQRDEYTAKQAADKAKREKETAETAVKEAEQREKARLEYERQQSQEYAGFPDPQQHGGQGRGYRGNNRKNWGGFRNGGQGRGPRSRGRGYY